VQELNTIKESTAMLATSRDVGLKVNRDKTKNMFMFHHQYVGHIIM